MMIHSPYAPMARASRVMFDWKSAAPNAAQWEKEAQHPEVFVALGRRAIADKRHADAERAFNRAIELSPEPLERFLKEPDPGLRHARVRVDIAEHLMAKKDYKSAEPYANAAAETYAAWAMLCAAKCAEGLADFATAEQWVQRVAERYDESNHVWFYWCLRTGRGNLPAAQAIVESHLKKIGTPKIQKDLFMAGVLQMATGQAEKAPALFLAAHAQSKSDYFPLLAAMEYDALGDTTRRDRALGLLSEKGPYQPVIALLRAKLAKGEKEAPSSDEIDTALKNLTPGLAVEGRYLIGRFLQRRGQDKLAIEQFRKCATEPMNSSQVAPVLAGMALGELEKKK
jgi:uncharacterized protein HemY